MSLRDDEGRTFGVLVRRYRERSGLTQQQLADFSTISVRAIRNIEHGKALNPRKHTVSLIADGLRLSATERGRLEMAALQGEPEDRLDVGYLSATAPHYFVDGKVVGREREMLTLHSALSGGVGQLLTITGLPGVGKTRIAVAVTERLRLETQTPVLWAECSSLPGSRPHRGRLAALVHDAGAELTGGTVAANRPDGAVAALADLVGERPAILVLDDVSPSAIDVERLERIRARCSRLTILVTSITPQGLPGEKLLSLGPLSLPGAEERSPCQVPAVSLFLREVSLLRPDLTEDHAEMDALVQVCRSLDGVPGALKAASSWLSVYEPGEFADMVRRDPVTALTPLTPDSGSAFLGTRLRDAIRRLGPRERELLGWLCESGSAMGFDGIARARGMSLADCGRLLRVLITGGFVRRRTEECQGPAPLFLVRALMRESDGSDSAQLSSALGEAVC